MRKNALVGIVTLMGHRCHYWSTLLATPSLHILPISCATSTLDTAAKTPEIRGSESGLNWTKRAADCFCFYPIWVTISEHRQWPDSSRNTKPISTKLSGTRNSYFWDFCLAWASSSSGTMRQWHRADQRSLPWHALLRYKMTNIFIALKLLGPRLEFGFYWFFWLRLHQVRGEGRRNLIKH